MDVSKLPFNQFIGLESGQPNDPCLVKLTTDKRHENHLGTIHASVLLALAEATSGAVIARHFSGVTGVIPVVRRFEAMFKRPATGRIGGKGTLQASDVERWKAEINTRGRVLITVPVEVVDDSGKVVMVATAEWFVAKER